MKRIVLAMVLAVSMIGCSSANYKPHPGAINLLDSQAYDVLISTHAVIEQTKADLAGGVWSASIASKVKTVLNTGVVPAYNVLDTTYQAYHNANNPTDPGTAVQTAVTNVTNQTAVLAAAKVGR
jgi:hypothetical protein